MIFSPCVHDSTIEEGTAELGTAFHKRCSDQPSSESERHNIPERFSLLILWQNVKSKIENNFRKSRKLSITFIALTHESGVHKRCVCFSALIQHCSCFLGKIKFITGGSHNVWSGVHLMGIVGVQMGSSFTSVSAGETVLTSFDLSTLKDTGFVVSVMFDVACVLLAWCRLAALRSLDICIHGRPVCFFDKVSTTIPFLAWIYYRFEIFDICFWNSFSKFEKKLKSERVAFRTEL